MTKTILLPGNSAQNRAWIEDVQSQIGGDILYYQHWENGEQMIDFAVEVERLKQLANGSPIKIVAKSAGVILAMKACQENAIQLEKAVFIGTPVNWGKERGIPVDTWLKEWKMPTLFVHKQDDWVISEKELSKILNGRYTPLVLEGNDHNYLEFNQYIDQVKEMLK